jgi:LysR family positive regulator for ilvC
MTVELADYAAFDELCRQAHFGRAAKKLGASPSALSRRIQALEQQLGVELLQRGPKSLRLTTAGETFLRFAREELVRMEGLRAELADSGAEPSGELRLACTVTACYSLLPKLIARCRRYYPRLSLQVLTQDAAQSFSQLESGEIDLAVIPTDADLPAEYSARPLGHAELIFIAPGSREDRGHLGPQLEELLEKPKGRSIDKRRVSRLLEEVPFVLQLAGMERRRLLAWFEEHGVTPRIAAEVRGNEGIIAMVGLGTGLALVPDLVLDRSPGEVTRMSGLVAPPGYEVSLCAKARSLKRKNVSAFWELSGSEPSPRVTL